MGLGTRWDHVDLMECVVKGTKGASSVPVICGGKVTGILRVEISICTNHGFVSNHSSSHYIEKN